ncbi:Hsp20/alpha crystallin family protein [Hespellia stercorisuis]|uniref:Molecular chaperone IbpA, HSP20 family n=1 Tax=Hespellia stercorisuis DSM 15480 TaxID=1121950 RepID=A0A1M6WGY9_9FIRM|nr:Hsp20/alpha crystallin family protein [Hespellia stercorisuis]SHK92987.1 Molecular chaperone IbpA, HSP20 family [Hespellia stercorisuis DSM 15480]
MPFGRRDFGLANSSITGGMSTDVQEFDDKYQLDLELPGFKKEDIQAELKDGYLTINAKHEENKDEKDEKGKFIRRERYSGQCQRSFYVGDAITQEDIKANFENGVLKVEVPKKEAKPRVEEKKLIAIEG